MQAAGPEKPVSEPEPATEAAPAPSAEPAPQPAPAAEATPTVDIWANATDEQKAAFEAADADAHRWQSDQGRAVVDIRRIAQLEATINAAAASKPAAAPADGVLVDVLKSDAWQSVDKELPELAAPLKKVLAGVQTVKTACKK